MKKVLLLTVLANVMFAFVNAQSTCRLDTTYNYQFLNGSSTKTPISRTIHYPAGANTASEQPEPRIVQDFNNNAWVNKSKIEVLYNPSGYYTEYKSFAWDSASTAWKADYQENVTYDANNRIIEYIGKEELNQDGTALINTWRNVYEYNAAGKRTKRQEYTWNKVSNSWVAKEQQLSTYNAADLITEELGQVWDTLAGAWVNDGRELRTYNANNKEILIETYSWDVTASAWKGIQSKTTAYDAQGFESENVYKQWDNGTNAFKNSYKYIYTRNASGKALTWEDQYWNTTLNVFERQAVRKYTYNANNVQTSYRYEAWSPATNNINSVSLSTTTLNAADLPLTILDRDSSSAFSGVWKDFRKWTYAYDANNNRISDLYELRPTGDSVLINFSRSTRTFNSNSKLLQESNDFWNANSSSWLPSTEISNEYDGTGFRTAYDYKTSWNTAGSYFNTHNRTEYICTLVSVGIVAAEENGISMYPNPVAKGSELLVDVAQYADFTLVDFYGRVLRTGKFNVGKNALITTELSPGFYLLNVSGRSFKVVVQ